MAKIKFKQNVSERLLHYVKTVTDAVNTLIEFSSKRVFEDDELKNHQCFEFLLTVGANVFRDCFDKIIITYAKSVKDDNESYEQICRNKDFQDQLIKNFTSGIVHALHSSEFVGDCGMSMENIISQVIDNLIHGEFTYSRDSDGTVKVSSSYNSDEDKRCSKCNCS